MLMILAGSGFHSIGQEVVSETHNIKINSENDYLKVEETITLKGETNENYNKISFWIMDTPSDLKIVINDNNVEDITRSGNTYVCNISSFNINVNSTVDVSITYNLNENIENADFTKKVLRDTNKITLNYDDNDLYSANDLKENTKFTMNLVKTQEETLSIFTIVAIFLLAILLIVFTAYFFKKQKITKKKHAASDSEEYLTTKKSLLMQLLKDIEKKHRAKKISDDTYHKLKDNYKNEAVDTMKKIEDIKEELE